MPPNLLGGEYFVLTMKKRKVVQRVFLILSIPQAVETLKVIYLIMIGVIILLWDNPLLFGIIFGILLGTAVFAIIGILLNRKGKIEIEKMVQVMDIQKDDVGMAESYTPPFPYIRIKQRIINGSGVSLRISSVAIDLTVNKRKLDAIQCSDFPADWIKTKDETTVVSPTDLDFWITYATTKLNQAIPDFNNHNLIIEASGKIELLSRTTRIKKDVGGEIKIEPKEWE